MYVGQITAAKCRLDLFNTAPVIVTGQLSINELPPPPSLCLQGGIVFHSCFKTLRPSVHPSVRP